MRAFGIPLADAPADDRLLRPGHADENVLIALGVDLMALGRSFASCRRMTTLVQFQPARSNADHHAVVQFHAAKADAEGQAANGATVDAGQARGGADADAFTKGGNDFNLLFAGKVVHEAHPSG